MKMPDAAVALHGQLASICGIALDAWLIVGAALIARARRVRDLRTPANLDARQTRLECRRVSECEGVTHLSHRVAR
jgi:hypothetical protein